MKPQCAAEAAAMCTFSRLAKERMVHCRKNPIQSLGLSARNGTSMNGIVQKIHDDLLNGPPLTGVARGGAGLPSEAEIYLAVRKECPGASPMIIQSYVRDIQRLTAPTTMPSGAC